MLVVDSLTNQIAIDPQRVSNTIVHFIRRKVAEHQKEGVALGLSGGIDSAVVATLATKAVVASKIHALHLFDRDSESKALEFARKTAAELEINFKAIDISQFMSERSVNLPPHSALLNKPLIYLYRLVCRLIFREDPYVSTLRYGGSAKETASRIARRPLALHIEESFNTRHRLRRRILENYAEERNLLLLGAANRTEFLIGWFVKGGIDDLPIEPLLGLYKSQVRQLAHFLGVLPEIIKESPSPDMLKGLTDELAIGFPYEKIDKVLYIIEHDLDEKAAFDSGVALAQFKAIKNLYQLSGWKRMNSHIYPTIN